VTELLGLPLWTATAGGLVEWLARFILRVNRSTMTGTPVPPDPSSADTGGIARSPRPAGGTPPPPEAASAARSHREAARAAGLTARQLEVIVLLRDGLRYDEVAAVLGISVRQVQRHVAGARDRLHAGTTAEVVARVVGVGLVPPPDLEA
jgi:DNA-binding CsgD family transcriptional regulator